MLRYTTERSHDVWEIFDNRLGQTKRSGPNVVKSTPIAYAYDYKDAQKIVDALNAQFE